MMSVVADWPLSQIIEPVAADHCPVVSKYTVRHKKTHQKFFIITSTILDRF